MEEEEEEDKDRGVVVASRSVWLNGSGKTIDGESLALVSDDVRRVWVSY